MKVSSAGALLTVVLIAGCGDSPNNPPAPKAQGDKIGETPVAIEVPLAVIVPNEEMIASAEAARAQSQAQDAHCATLTDLSEDLASKRPVLDSEGALGCPRLDYSGAH